LVPGEAGDPDTGQGTGPHEETSTAPPLLLLRSRFSIDMSDAGSGRLTDRVASRGHLGIALMEVRTLPFAM